MLIVFTFSQKSYFPKKCILSHTLDFLEIITERPGTGCAWQQTQEVSSSVKGCACAMEAQAETQAEAPAEVRSVDTACSANHAMNHPRCGVDTAENGPSKVWVTELRTTHSVSQS